MKPELPLSTETLQSSQQIPPVAAESAIAVNPALLADPLFQQIIKELAEAREHIKAQAFILDRLAAIFRECEVASLGMSSAESEEALRNRLRDGRSIQLVVQGQQKASELLAGIEKVIPAEVFTAIVVDLSAFLAPRLQKFVEELVDAGPGSRAVIAAAMLVTGMKAWEAHRPVFEHRMVTLQQFQRRIHELSTQAGISDPREVQSIETEISLAIGGDALALTQLESGDLGEVDRLFCERTRRDKISIQ